jgi:hypothetical protein
MIDEGNTESHDRCSARQAVLSRRAAIGTAAFTLLGASSMAGLTQEAAAQRELRGAPREILERMEKSREFSERMRNAGSPEERNTIMEERNAWERTRAIDDIKKQLEVSDQEWSVVKPRVEAVYNLAHPQPQFGNARAACPVDRGKSELREVLGDKNSSAEQIKGKLTALRAAQVNANQELAKARQSLRQIMTLRQEATLVLNGLLD